MSEPQTSPADQPDFDTSLVDVWIGVPLGGGQRKDPVAANQKDEIMAAGDAEIRLPTETLPAPAAP